LRSVEPFVDFGKRVVRVGKHVLPVVKYGSSCEAKSVHVSSKSRPSGHVRFENSFELLED
jgi:hypothetical protein